MGTGEDTSAGVATEEAQGVAQGFAQDVASIVCKHLDMKVVLERTLSRANSVTARKHRTGGSYSLSRHHGSVTAGKHRRVEATPFRAGIMAQ